ncbi:coiled-coil domain-containing protein 134-like [Odontomachus brunneus]|uniref:coiled-coil domain-containing protein 134-like n=1 Tax=Odontomachus brunneus TaxID=486640 RepID=UPI0013F24FC1|nr:coiled-coil domain-containing protein 134-like [Odontomachus brunneus]
MAPLSQRDVSNSDCVRTTRTSNGDINFSRCDTMKQNEDRQRCRVPRWWSSLAMYRPRRHRLPRVFLHIVVALLLLLLTVSAHTQREIDGPMENEPRKSVESKSKLDEELFKRLFAQRRKDHIQAVHALLKMDNYERLYKMIAMLAEKVVEVIESSKSVIEKAAFVPNNSSFPEDTNVKEALSNILENTALFGDIILHLPDISHRILKAQQSLNSTIHWSLNFANRTRYLLDKSTITMIHLVEQELNITERDPNYFNRYRSAAHVDEREDDSKATTATKKKKKQSAKRDKRKKGPQIAKIEL